VSVTYPEFRDLPKDVSFVPSGQLRWSSFVALSLIDFFVLGDRQLHVSIYRRPRVSGEERAQFLAGHAAYLM